MSDTPRYETGYAESERNTPKQQLADSELYRADLEAVAEQYSPKRERLFSRKVLIGWALATLAVYGAVKVARTAIKESVKQAAVYTTGLETSPDQREVIYTTPNGKITITKNRRNGQIIISRNRGRAGPATIATPPMTVPAASDDAAQNSAAGQPARELPRASSKPKR